MISISTHIAGNTGSKIDGPQNLADPKYISKCHRLKTEYGPKMFRIDDDDNRYDDDDDDRYVTWRMKLTTFQLVVQIFCVYFWKSILLWPANSYILFVPISLSIFSSIHLQS